MLLRRHRPLHLADFRRRGCGAGWPRRIAFDRGLPPSAVLGRHRWPCPVLGGREHLRGDVGKAQSYSADRHRRTFDGRTQRRRRAVNPAVTTYSPTLARCRHQRRVDSSRLLRLIHTLGMSVVVLQDIVVLLQCYGASGCSHSSVKL